MFEYLDIPNKTIVQFRDGTVGMFTKEHGIGFITKIYPDYGLPSFFWTGTGISRLDKSNDIIAVFKPKAKNDGV